MSAAIVVITIGKVSINPCKVLCLGLVVLAECFAILRNVISCQLGSRPVEFLAQVRGRVSEHSVLVIAIAILQVIEELGTPSVGTVASEDQGNGKKELHLADKIWSGSWKNKMG